jgi:hypothetical protein
VFFAGLKDTWGQLGRDEQEARRGGGNLKFFDPRDAGFQDVEETELKSAAVEFKCQAV